MEASGFLVGPSVFNTDVGAQAPRRVRFPSASAMTVPSRPLLPAHCDACVGAYTAHLETDVVVLRDGSTERIRPTPAVLIARRRARLCAWPPPMPRPATVDSIATGSTRSPSEPR